MSDSSKDGDRPSEPRSVALHSPALHDALADSRRRAALSLLRERDEPVAVADLAADVAARERDVPVEDVSDEAAQRVCLSLYHRDVPKLADAGLVSFDQERKTVTLREESTAPVAGALDAVDSA